MTNKLATIKQRAPWWAARAYRKASTTGRDVRRRLTRGGDRVAALEAEVAEARARARRAEMRIDLVREQTAVAARAAEVELAAARDRARRLEDQIDLAREHAAGPAPSTDATPPGAKGAISDASRDGDLPPSFRYKMGEQRRISSMLTDGLGVGEPVWQVNAKLAGREWAAGLGVRVPELLAGPIPIHDLDVEQLPDHLVVKPVSGHSSRGVFLLHRTEPDRYRSLLDRNETYTRQQLLDRYDQWLEKGSIPDTVIVERLLFDGAPETPRPPIDFRFFCFYGEVGFVMARDGHGTRAGRRVRFRFFDDCWNDLGVVRLDVRNDPGIAVPRRAEEMVHVARQLSEAIPRAMVRIDLFDAPDAVYFGEVTPFPGGNFAMEPEHDRRFGEQWERAEARLERDAIEAGVRTLRA